MQKFANAGVERRPADNAIPTLFIAAPGGVTSVLRCLLSRAARLAIFCEI
jgi:hypothetical protein